MGPVHCPVQASLLCYVLVTGHFLRWQYGLRATDVGQVGNSDHRRHARVEHRGDNYSSSHSTRTGTPRVTGSVHVQSMPPLPVSLPARESDARDIQLPAHQTDAARRELPAQQTARPAHEHTGSVRRQVSRQCSGYEPNSAGGRQTKDNRL
uniref:Secreted protein n=1 Tax=Cacopsylla melanoneura TaxID=428564 RepID=A0A8D8YMM2_9HEMI